MSTDLDVPVENSVTVTEQRVNTIIMNMADGTIVYHIDDYNTTVQVNALESNVYTELFSAIPAGPVKEDFRDVLNNIRALARNKGQLGDGTDTDPF